MRTATALKNTAQFINIQGLHTGPQYAVNNPWRLDICAAIYINANNCISPAVFYTDEAASERLIRSSPLAMEAIRAISDALDTDVCETDGQPDYTEHVSAWAIDTAETTAAGISEVIGRLLRIADQLNAPTAA